MYATSAIMSAIILKYHCYISKVCCSAEYVGCVRFVATS